MFIATLVVLGQGVIFLVALIAFCFLANAWLDADERHVKQARKKQALVETSQIPSLLMQDVSFCKTNPRMCMKVVEKIRDEHNCVLVVETPALCGNVRTAYAHVSPQVLDYAVVGEYVLLPATHCVFTPR